VTTKIDVPAEILEAARANFRAPEVLQYFNRIRDQLGVPPDAGPADFPEGFWALYSELRDAGTPGATTAPISDIANSVLGLLLTDADLAEVQALPFLDARNIRAKELLETKE